MAILKPIKLLVENTSSYSFITSDFTNGQLPENIDEGIGNEDGNVIDDTANSDVLHRDSYRLQAPPGDFISMSLCSITASIRVQGSQTNDRSLVIKLTTDNGQNQFLARNDNNFGANPLTSTTMTAYALDFPISAVQNSLTNTADSWSLARITFEVDTVRNKGGDTNGLEIDTVELNGIYWATETGVLDISPDGITWANISEVDAVAAGSIANIDGQS